MEYIHVRSLEKYHPGYKDRKLIWAKIYFDMVQGDPDCELIEKEVDFARLIKIIILELQAQRPLPNNDAYWTRKGFNLKTRKMSLTLQVLHNFIEPVTDLYKTCNVDIYKEDIYKQEEDKEKIQNEPPSVGKLPDGSFGRLKAEYLNKYKEWFKVEPAILKADVFALQRMIRKHGEEEVSSDFIPYFKNEVKDNWRERCSFSLSAMEKAVGLAVFNQERKDKVK